YGILTGTISFGTLTAITQLITQIQTPFANITGYLPRYYAMIASAERLMAAEEFKVDDADVLNADKINEFYSELDEFGFKDVCFSYPELQNTVCTDEPDSDGLNTESEEQMTAVLNHLSFTIHKGEYVAFTGQSGCGKSTALKLLMCVYQPDSGSRYYRDAQENEGELTTEYRRLFSYVPQGNMLMNGSIREVVSFAKVSEASDDDRLWQVLRIACADGFVSELEQGLDTGLGERGTGLSEGQMQRLSIARALYADTPLLLLDEATSALDTDTEKKLLNNLRRLTDKTVIIVTHRKAALSICDRVLEFTEDGIVEKKDIG
ncbi:MAG: ABC transporter ATP-binding protein, partial [Lachnospiraceae bacterium]|nr:ABC transporter ATP-binding protein [Lachnospiraceae bacterium]